MLKYATDKTFEEEVIKNEKVVLVDFYADWCGPCKMIAPILEKVAKDHEEFDIVKVNVDQNQQVSMEYQIQSIPTLGVFKNGKEVDRIIGFSSEIGIVNTVKKHL